MQNRTAATEATAGPAEPARTSVREIDGAGWTRREFGKLGLGLAASVGGLALGGRAARADDTKLVTEIPENAAIVSGLQYMNESPLPDNVCAGCVLYTAGENDRGKCTLFPQGVVSAKGHCLSWAAKPA